MTAKMSSVVISVEVFFMQEKNAKFREINDVGDAEKQDTHNITALILLFSKTTMTMKNSKSKLFVVFVKKENILIAGNIR